MVHKTKSLYNHIVRVMIQNFIHLNLMYIKYLKLFIKTKSEIA